MDEKLPRRTEKPWGFELLFAQTPKYAGKLIFVKKGHRLSLQYHEKKDETMYFHQGKALLEIEDDGQMVPVMLEPGQSIRIPPHTRHRLKALEDSTIFEVSTPELDDIVRLEDDYGRAK
ncbi:MAG: cupin domain-containing protein [Chloroflexi bacterium]|nr:cupin domain-containing protein [Chloroflexota bacterium]